MPRVLIVDDNEDNRNVLGRRLARRELEVDEAEDGPSALRRLEDGVAYDCVLLDVMMPGMSGLEVLAAIRARYDKLQLPVIMATAKSEAEDVVEALKAGANDYVTKPIDFPIFFARLQSVLTMREAYLATAAPPDTSTLDHIGAGTVLHGRYELSEMIGRGGFAAVYEAKQVSTGQRVAVKMLHEDLITDVHLARFEREMQVIAQLQHPHVVRLIDYGHVRSTASVKFGPSATGAPPQRARRPPVNKAFEIPYLVMEHLVGEPLDQALSRDGGMAPTATVDMLLPVVSAVGTAHEQSVIHRDLKPANIFLARGPGATVRPIVLDFGIAKPSGFSALTTPNAMVGTPQYMSPEQAIGSADVDHRADQYSLGILLFESLTGRSPFHGMSFFQVVHAVSQGEIPAPSEWTPGVPAGLDAIVKRATTRAPDERYASVYDFGLALLDFASAGVRAQWRDALRPSMVPSALELVSNEPNSVEAPAAAVRSGSAAGEPAGRAPSASPSSTPPPRRLRPVSELPPPNRRGPRGDQGLSSEGLGVRRPERSLGLRPVRRPASPQAEPMSLAGLREMTDLRELGLRGERSGGPAAHGEGSSARAASGPIAGRSRGGAGVDLGETGAIELRRPSRRHPSPPPRSPGGLPPASGPASDVRSRPPAMAEEDERSDRGEVGSGGNDHE